jgi:hypothetical protein
MHHSASQVEIYNKQDNSPSPIVTFGTAVLIGCNLAGVALD